MKYNLVCIDTYYCIKKRDTIISELTIEKVDKVWSEGHSIVLIIHK